MLFSRLVFSAIFLVLAVFGVIIAYTGTTPFLEFRYSGWAVRTFGVALSIANCAALTILWRAIHRHRGSAAGMAEFPESLLHACAISGGTLFFGILILGQFAMLE